MRPDEQDEDRFQKRLHSEIGKVKDRLRTDFAREVEGLEVKLMQYVTFSRTSSA